MTQLLTQTADSEMMFESDVDVLNYALTLEHLEAVFYREALETYGNQDFLDLGFQTSVRDRIAMIGDHEASHVATLTSVISDLGGEPAQEATYNFGYTNLAEFFTTAGAIENTGVAAYTGAARFLIDNDDLLTAALTIHGVEARHAAYLNVINATSPFPDGFDAPLTPEEVLDIAGPFIVVG